MEFYYNERRRTLCSAYKKNVYQADLFNEAGIESGETEEEQNTVEAKNYPPQKKIINYILRQTSYIQHNSRLEDLDKVQEMTNLLEALFAT